MDCKNILEKFKGLIFAAKRVHGRSDERRA
jgi:hypothetical protein